MTFQPKLKPQDLSTLKSLLVRVTNPALESYPQTVQLSTELS